MKKKRRDDFGRFLFYAFWVCILLLASIVVIFIFYKADPAFVQRILSQTPSSPPPAEAFLPTPPTAPPHDKVPSQPFEPVLAEPPPPETPPEPRESATPPAPPHSGDSSLSDETRRPFPPEESPLFDTATLSGTSFFIEDDGSAYTAGSITVQGLFPRDFSPSLSHMPDTDRLFAVAVTLTIGWENLLPLPELSEISQQTSIGPFKVKIPPLQMLSARVVFLDSTPLAPADNDAMRTDIKTHLSRLFARENVPRHISAQARQRLAASYVQRGYPTIVLLSL